MTCTGMCRWTGYGFFPSVLNRVYNFPAVLNRFCLNHKKGIACAIELIWLMNFACTSKQTNRINIMCICSIAIANKWLQNKTARILS